MSKAISIALLAAAVTTAAAFSCLAGSGPTSDDMRRLAAELVVMRDDIAGITAEPTPDARHRQALIARLRGAAAFLPILIRIVDQDAPAPKLSHQDRTTILQGLRADLAAENWTGARGALTRLIALYPFDATGLTAPTDTAAASALGARLHEKYCAACHEGGDNADWPPIPNLYEMAKTAPEAVLLPRFFNGVRGDASTALEQPLSAGDIAALIAYYRATASPF